MLYLNWRFRLRYNLIGIGRICDEQSRRAISDQTMFNSDLLKCKPLRPKRIGIGQSKISIRHDKSYEIQRKDSSEEHLNPFCGMGTY